MKQESELYKMCQTNTKLRDSYFQFLDDALEVIESNPELPQQIAQLLNHAGETK